jgi:hypothetical protein
MIKLTGRQRAFLGKFLDLYRDAQKPLHYVDVAEAIGVARNTAYDMLRVLEKRGLVRSEYVLKGRGHGAGRSMVVSVPTSGAFSLFAEHSAVSLDRTEWEKVRRYILSALRQHTDYHELLDDLVARLSERTTPLIYSAQMATAVILNLLLVEREAPASALVARLKELGLPDERGLGALSGLTVGLSFVDRANQRISDRLVAANARYQQSLGRLGAEGKRHLSSFVQEVLAVVAA